MASAVIAPASSAAAATSNTPGKEGENSCMESRARPYNLWFFWCIQCHLVDLTMDYALMVKTTSHFKFGTLN